MAPAKKTTKKTAAKKAPAKKTVAKKAAPAAPAAVETAPTPAPAALPAPPDGFTWSADSTTGNIILVRTGEATAPPAQANVEEVQLSKSKTIRNMRSVPVHLRLKGNGDKAYRIQLDRRGWSGDTAEVPEACLQDTAFVRSYNLGLFEIISKTEAQQIQYASRGFKSRDLNIIRPDETTVAHKSFDTNKKGQVSNQQNLMPANLQAPVGQATTENVGPQVVSLPGTDPSITAQFQASQSRRLNQAASALQADTGRAEHAPNNLVAKGVMPELPQVAGIQRTQQF